MNASLPFYNSLSEDAIKRAFVPFLKDFYKNRYAFHHESFEAHTDNVSASGIIADGMVRFRREDGREFLCTYEATSLDKTEEVRYTLNTKYLMWDALAFGAFATALNYAVLYYFGFEWLHGLQTIGNIGLVLGIGMITFFAWQLLMQNWRKYRYIYAVEQFKRYFAHEQWIALGEDVFPAPTDPYLTELKNQCMYHGFGLAFVHKTGLVRIVMAPSRLGIFGKDRRMADWVTQNQWFQTVANNLKVVTQTRSDMPSITTRTVNFVFRPINQWVIKPVNKFFLPQAGDVNRYMTVQGVQKWIFALSLMLVMPLMFHVFKYEEQAFTDTEKYLPKRYEENPEDETYYIEKNDPVPDDAYDGQGIPKQYPLGNRTAASDEAINTIDLSSGDEEEPVKPVKKPVTKPVEKPKPAFKPKPIEPKKNQSVSIQPVKPVDPCSVWDTRKGWIIQDNAFSARETANLRVKALQQRGLKAEVVAKKCFSPGGSGFIVLLDVLFSKETEARIRAAEILEALERYNLDQGSPLVKSINL